jgi:hypothetical protein
MRLRFEKKRGHISGYSTGGFFDSFRRAIHTGKNTRYAVTSSTKNFNSQKEEDLFQIQAEIARDNALLCEIMIPPR